MTSGWAATITAIATLITAIGGLLLSFTVFIPMFRTAKSTHKLVNQRFTDITNFNSALIRALNDNGVKVPIDQSLGIGTTKETTDGTAS